MTDVDTAASEKILEIAKEITIRKLTSVLGRQLPALSALYPSDLGQSDFPSRMLATPASNVGDFNGIDLQHLAGKRGTAEVGHRLVPGSEPGRPLGEFEWAVTDSAHGRSKVRVRGMSYNPSSNAYEFRRDGENQPTLTWTPIVHPSDNSTNLPTATNPTTDYTGQNGELVLPEMEIYPEDSLEPDDYILVFPADSDIPTQYIVFRNPRDFPGVATGEGQVVSGAWLGDSTRSKGAPIPSRIADQLRGQKFTNFNKFREALWKAVAEDSVLSSEFTERNLAQMKQGKAPYPRQIDQAGGRDKFELHHLDAIANGGAVYDLENIVIMTPKQHIQHHQENKS